MLNQNDRRRLEEIERQLGDEDPEFVRRFTRLPPRRRGMSRLWPIAVVVIGVLGVLISLVVVLPAVLVLAVAVTIAGVVWLRRRNRSHNGRAARRER